LITLNKNRIKKTDASGVASFDKLTALDVLNNPTKIKLYFSTG